MSHTDNYAKNDPYVAEIASKLDAILEQYDDVLGNVQIPFNVGQAMVKAHERGEKSKFESQLQQYQLYTSPTDSPYNSAWEMTKGYYIHQKELRDIGRKMTSWVDFAWYVKFFLDVFNRTDNPTASKKPRKRRKKSPWKRGRSWHNIQVVYYSYIDR